MNQISAGTDAAFTEKSGAPKLVALNAYAITALKTVIVSQLNAILPSASTLTGVERINASFQNVLHVQNHPRVSLASVKITSVRMELPVVLSNVSCGLLLPRQSCRPRFTSPLRPPPQSLRLFPSQRSQASPFQDL